MNRTTISWWKMILWVVIVIATLLFLRAVSSILLPFVLAFIISVLLEPTIQRLRRRGMSRKLSVNIVFLLFFGIVTAIGVRVVPMVGEQVSGFSSGLESMTRTLSTGSQETVFTRWNPVVRMRSDTLQNPVDKMLDQFHEPLERFGIPTNRRALYQRFVEPYRDRIAKTISNFFGGFLGIVINAGSNLLMLLFTPLFVWLMLMDMERLKVRSAGWIPTSIRAETISLLREVGSVFISYLRGVTLSVSIYMCLFALILSLVGAPYSLLLAVLVGTIYLIPIFGKVISFASILVATGLSGKMAGPLFSVGDPWTFGLIIASIYFVVDLLYDNLVNPQLMGRAVGLNMLASMFVVFSGGALFGVIGMILAFPVAGSVKVILEKVLRLTTSHSVDNLRLPETPLRHRTASEV